MVHGAIARFGHTWETQDAQAATRRERFQRGAQAPRFRLSCKKYSSHHLGIDFADRGSRPVHVVHLKCHREGRRYKDYSSPEALAAAPCSRAGQMDSKSQNLHQNPGLGGNFPARMSAAAS